WALLSGACGQFFGNDPIWHFDGPGLFPPKTTWRMALSSTGSKDMVRLRNLFAGLPWQQLAPDFDHRLATDGFGNGLSTAVTAKTADNKLSLTYFPSNGKDPRPFTIDLSQWPGTVKGRWYNPANGQFESVEGSPFRNGGLLRLSTPGDNSTGTNDWLLILQSD